MEVDDNYLRRASHTVGACAVLYYALPMSIYGAPRLIIPALAIILTTVGEFARRRKGALIPGLRDFERHRIASFYYYGMSIVLLLLLAPQVVAIACILLMAFVDPFMGETRGRTWSIPAAIAFGAFLMYAAGFGPEYWPFMIAGAVTAVVMESVSHHPLDDDYTMSLGTALVLMGMSMFLELPGDIIHSLEGAWW